MILMIINLLFLIPAEGKEVIKFSPSADDMTPIVSTALKDVSDSEIELIFAKGIYHFYPDYAKGEYCAITNHDNGWKKIIFPLNNFDQVTIQGNGAEFIFHGQAMPFQFKECGKITISDIIIDWDVPFTIQGEVLNVDLEKKWIDLKMFTAGYSWKLKNERLTFPNINGYSFKELGSALAFDSKYKRVVHGGWDRTINTHKAEEKEKGTIRVYDNFKHAPPQGSVLNFKGPKGENRYAPAIHVVSSKNIEFDKVVVHHALGMGFLLERTENAKLSNCGVYVREGSDRLISATADATHFCNCKGDIIVENCRFQHMLDDGTNVHGTYGVVDKVIDDYTLRVGLEHFQQAGFEFAASGDDIWFIRQPNPSRKEVRTVSAIKVINETYFEITFGNVLPANIRKGDVLENKTWNPTFTMRGCTISDHRARNIVIKTPKKVLIENNDFSSMMSSIFFRGETYFWYESGNVEDVLIRNNRFVYCAYSGAEHAILRITPRLGKTFDQTQLYDRNIRFEDNIISTFDNRIVWADRVDGLVIKGNTINKTKESKSLYPNAYQFEFGNCRNVKLMDNTYYGTDTKFVLADKKTSATLEMKGNQGFNKSAISLNNSNSSKNK